MAQPADLSINARIAVLPGLSMVNNFVSGGAVGLRGPRGARGFRGFTGADAPNPDPNPYPDPYSNSPSAMSAMVETVEL